MRFFDERRLQLLRWVSERYLAPLSVVIERSYPPRVAGEERAPAGRPGEAGAGHAERGRPQPAPSSGVLARYGEPERLLEAGSVTWLRPLPDDEALVCVEAVGACAAAGRQGLVLVPEAEPLPATARAVLDAFGDRAVFFAGGDERTRYRTWLDIQSGRHDVVVGTRPAVFAPLNALGLIWISREAHPGHREERSPTYHVREVAVARARLEGAACVLASLSPSVETAVLAERDDVRVARAPRSLERAAAPLVETTAPEAEDRSPRLTRLLRSSRTAALIVSRRGYGVARICRTCGAAARCSACGGPIVAEGGEARCAVCGLEGRCSTCGDTSFGLEPGGTERMAEWAARVSPSGIEVGTAAMERNAAHAHAGRRHGASTRTAAAGGRDRSVGRRVRCARPSEAGCPCGRGVRRDPAAGGPRRAARRAEAGFAPTHPVFRIAGQPPLEERLCGAGAETVLATTLAERTVCLAAVRPERLAEFRRDVLRLVVEGIADRVEAEPQIS
ncbi:MAG: hypothetical protein E6G47_00105 [Actinobacteria bacterium]|nr:MAG: hypothetical protein E6G47_00105 [Actinomycetota bacterium]